MSDKVKCRHCDATVEAETTLELIDEDISNLGRLKLQAESALEGTLPPFDITEEEWAKAIEEFGGGWTGKERCRTNTWIAKLLCRERHLRSLTAELAAEKEKRETYERTVIDAVFALGIAPKEDKPHDWINVRAERAEAIVEAFDQRNAELVAAKKKVWLLEICEKGSAEYLLAETQRAERAEAENKALRDALQNTGRAVGETYCWCRTQAWDCGNPSCEQARAALAAAVQKKE